MTVQWIRCEHLIFSGRLPNLSSPLRDSGVSGHLFQVAFLLRTMADPLVLLPLSLLGLIGGFLAGLLGIGGGMVLVPFITYILGTQGVAPELAIKMAIATSMATIVFTSMSSVRAHHQHGAVRWDLVKRLAPGIVLGGLLASLGIFAVLKGSYLGLFFGANLALAFLAWASSSCLIFLRRFILSTRYCRRCEPAGEPALSRVIQTCTAPFQTHPWRSRGASQEIAGFRSDG